MFKIRTIIILIILIGAGLIGAFYLHSGDMPYRRATQHALDEFHDAVKTKQIGKIGEAFKHNIASNAKIRLAVTFTSPASPKGGVPDIQDFDKSSFFLFIDNVLYSMQDYGFDSSISSFKLDLDKSSASAIFHVSSWGDSELSYGELHTNTHFDAEGSCQVQILFDTNIHALFNAMDCAVKLSSRPKLVDSSSKN